MAKVGASELISKAKFSYFVLTHTFLIKVLWRSYGISGKFTWGDHVLNSHDLRV